MKKSNTLILILSASLLTIIAAVFTFFLSGSEEKEPTSTITPSSTFQFSDSTPFPDGSTADPIALTNAIEQLFSGTYEYEVTPEPYDPSLYEGTPEEICNLMEDMSTRCYESVAAFIYEMTDGQLTVVPDNIPLHIAIPTFNAFVMTNNVPQSYDPTPFPDGSTVDPIALTNAIEQLFSGTYEYEMTPEPYDPSLYEGTPQEFCTTMPDAGEQCFESVAAFVYEMTDGQLTVVPDNIPLHIAIPTFNAFVMTNNASQSYEPTPFPDGSTADLIALTNMVRGMFGTPTLTPNATP